MDLSDLRKLSWVVDEYGNNSRVFIAIYIEPHIHQSLTEVPAKCRDDGPDSPHTPQQHINPHPLSPTHPHTHTHTRLTHFTFSARAFILLLPEQHKNTWHTLNKQKTHTCASCLPPVSVPSSPKRIRRTEMTCWATGGAMGGAYTALWDRDLRWLMMS